jgi:hypothetical protein
VKRQAERHLTLKEAAQRLGVTPDRLALIAGDGGAPGAKLGFQGWRFPAAVIESLYGFPRRPMAASE